MDFGDSASTPSHDQGNFWGKVLQYVQGRNKDSNLFARYVEMKNAKREIEAKFSSDHSLAEAVLNSRELFSQYIFDTYLLGDLKRRGAMFKEDDKYKIYMNLITDDQLYSSIRSNYLMKEPRRFRINKRFIEFCKGAVASKGVEMHDAKDFKYIPRRFIKPNLNSPSESGSPLINTRAIFTPTRDSKQFFECGQMTGNFSDDFDNLQSDLQIKEAYAQKHSNLDLFQPMTPDLAAAKSPLISNNLVNIIKSKFSSEKVQRPVRNSKYDRICISNNNDIRTPNLELNESNNDISEKDSTSESRSTQKSTENKTKKQPVVLHRNKRNIMCLKGGSNKFKIHHVSKPDRQTTIKNLIKQGTLRIVPERIRDILINSATKKRNIVNPK